MSLCSEMTWLPRAYLPAPVQLLVDDDVSRAYEAAARHGPSSYGHQKNTLDPITSGADSEVSRSQYVLGWL